jgi:hypothetical protein
MSESAASQARTLVYSGPATASSALSFPQHLLTFFVLAFAFNFLKKKNRKDKK